MSIRFFVGLVYVFVAAAAAQTPLGTGFQYQGRLTQNGDPVTGLTNLSFSLWNAPGTGNPPAGGVPDGAPQTINGVQVNGGLFNVILNSNGEFGPSAFNGDARWLQIAVNGTTLAPRQPLNVAPYAQYARGGPGGSGPWALNGSSIYNSNPGKVGIGTPTPARALQVGSPDVPNSEGMIRLASRSGISNETRTWDIGVPETGADAINGYSFIIDDVLLGTESEFMVQWGTGNVGIGTMFPLGRLDVRSGDDAYFFIDDTWGDIHANGGSDGVFGIFNDFGLPEGRTSIIAQGNECLTVANTGNVGVGTTSPGMSLEVRAPSYYGSPAIGGSQKTFLNFTDESWAYLHVSGPYDHSLIWDRAKAMRFGTESSRGAGYVEHMRINRDGKVHIGGETPAAYATLNVTAQPGTTGIVGRAGGDYQSGVLGLCNDFIGVGVYGATTSGTAVVGVTTGDGVGVYGQAYGSTKAGLFHGNVLVEGTLSKLAGSFKIDHPLDPANKYLQHSFVESPDMKNVYDGVVTTDGRGYATVELPAWFESLNKDCRYQLTVLDEADEAEFVSAKVVKRIHDNRFTIRTSRPNTEVSWQVTGIRKDVYAEAHRIIVEEDKPPKERGRYLKPELYGKSEEFSVDAERLNAIHDGMPDHFSKKGEAQ